MTPEEATMAVNRAIIGARRTLLSWLALIGVLLPSCGRGRPESTGQPPAPYRDRAEAATDSTLPSNILNVTWQWVSFTSPVEQITVDAPERYTIRFGRDGRAAVRADCNRGSSGYSVSADRRIALGPIVLTRMMCPPGSLDARFVKEFGRATSYFLEEGYLFLELPVDSGTLRFRRQT
jgi:heat shock protein HslJ